MKLNLQVQALRQRDSLDGLDVFIAVAEAGSFSEAGRRLGISASAVSQAVKSLEVRLGTSLFRRSTRSLSLTDVGSDYLRAVAPALSQLRRASEEASGRSGRPAGPLRLTMPRAPFELVVAPKLAAFREAYPAVELEIAVEARMVDIVKEGYDAGLRYGNHLDQDMVAVPVSPASEAILVGSPTYLEHHAMPKVPDDLLKHHAMVCRSQETGVIIPWTLYRGGKAVKVTPPFVTVVHDLASQIALAVRGMGVAFPPVALVSDLLDSGKLVRVLPAWSGRLDTTYLYFPSRRHRSPALRAFIEFMRQ
ncbi:LysR family transcriptional regulator [Luteibacter jiangsuensis]|uniref:LysR family transcriptional regulator n=1 Tax=Luteibacter jiangsuensis TaxID=637577 RepID=A0ABX0Q5P8_9GAMM|nr:LysR family transcriptional regulator [Luteibacter jiangsuensis]NID05859.1 LysR family transcriptional regulator [Luteibacter jiangsuensis]